MAKKWMSKHSQQLLLLAMLFIIFAVLAEKSEYFLAQENMRSILKVANYRTMLAVGMTFVISSGVMDLSVGSIMPLRGVLIALALHGEVGIWASVLTDIVAGDLMRALSGVLIYCTGINFFMLTLASSGMLRGVSLMITGGKPIIKLGKKFMQLGTGHTGEFQVPVLFALALILLFFPLMLHIEWGNHVRALGGGGPIPRRPGVRTDFYRVSIHMLLDITTAVTAVIITARLNSVEPNAGMNMELDATTTVIMDGTPTRGGSASITGIVLAVLIPGSIRDGLTLLSVSSSFQQWITGFLLLASVLISETRVWNIKALTK